MVSTPEQETLQLRALKLQTPIKGTFGLSTLTLGCDRFNPLVLGAEPVTEFCVRLRIIYCRCMQTRNKKRPPFTFQ